MLIFATSLTKTAMKTVVLTMILLLICVVLLGIKVLFVKGARFPSGHTASLRRKGIGCATGLHDKAVGDH